MCADSSVSGSLWSGLKWLCEQVASKGFHCPNCFGIFLLQHLLVVFRCRTKGLIMISPGWYEEVIGGFGVRESFCPLHVCNVFFFVRSHRKTRWFISRGFLWIQLKYIWCDHHILWSHVHATQGGYGPATSLRTLLGSTSRAWRAPHKNCNLASRRRSRKGYYFSANYIISGNALCI